MITNQDGRSLFSIPLKRRVYFAFHYQRDLSAVNTIRTSWMEQSPERNEGLGFFDGSLWESSQRKDPESLKTLIRDGMNNTSVVCVLSGAETYQRPWVRYEIIRSMVDDKGLFTVKLDLLKKSESSLTFGFALPMTTLLTESLNPLSFVGIIRESLNEYRAIELSRNSWIYANDYKIKFPKPKFVPELKTGHCYSLSSFTREYRYLVDGGKDEFPQWCALAAAEAGRFYAT